MPLDPCLESTLWDSLWRAPGGPWLLALGSLPRRLSPGISASSSPARCDGDASASPTEGPAVG
eukprot:5565046-Alexandrium_andersonii.AAC.1